MKKNTPVSRLKYSLNFQLTCMLLLKFSVCFCSYTADQLQSIRASFVTHTPFIRALTIALTLLTILWEMMLVATAIYFHNLPQKLTGAAFAALGWFISYRVWYSPAIVTLSSWTPGPPGRGLIKYQKDS